MSTKPHGHYFHDVAHLQHVDIYRMLALLDWLALGHSEAALRKLAKATAWAVAPAPVPAGKE